MHFLYLLHTCSTMVAESKHVLSMGLKIKLSSGSGTAPPLNLNRFCQAELPEQKTVKAQGHDILDLGSGDI